MTDREPQITTRAMRLADGEVIAAWLEGTGLLAPAGGASGWQRMLGDPRIRCSVGVDAAGHSVGFYRLDVAPDTTAEITLVVAPAARRRGVGTALLECALAEARELGLRRIVAIVADSGVGAREFFAVTGFESTEGEPPGFLRFERLIHTGGRLPPLEITP